MYAPNLLFLGTLALLAVSTHALPVRTGGLHPPDLGILLLTGGFNQIFMHANCIAIRKAVAKLVLRSGKEHAWDGVGGAPIVIRRLAARSSSLFKGNEDLFSSCDCLI